VLLVRVLRGDQVAEVDRVKATSKETNLHKRISLNRSPPLGKWLITPFTLTLRGERGGAHLRH
jgi:hypothetical protein